MAKAKYQFVAICPNNHLVTQDGFQREDLRKRITAREELRLYCVACDTSWNAAADLIESIRRSLDEK